MSKQKLTIIYGNSPREMTIKILNKIEPFKNLKKSSLIALKPNLVNSRPADSGATTSPEIARGIIEYLQERGFKNIIIMESSWLGDNTEKAYKVCGYDAISNEYGVPLIDLKRDKTKKIKCSGELTLNVCTKALGVDYLINLPVLKAHCQTRLTCALKNLKGCIPDSEKRRFHSLGLHKPIAYLNKVIKNDLVIVDGIMGDLTHEEGGNPVEMGRIIAGFDPVLVDSYAAGLIGYQTKDIPYIKMAEELGIGSLYDENTPVEEIDKNRMPPIKIRASDKARYLAQWVEENEACSPCYGNLIHALQRLEDAGKLKNLNRKIYIGRGFKDSEENNWGVGSCTKGMKRNLTGCPPETREIIKYLAENTVKNSEPF